MVLVVLALCLLNNLALPYLLGDQEYLGGLVFRLDLGIPRFLSFLWNLATPCFPCFLAHHVVLAHRDSQCCPDLLWGLVVLVVQVTPGVLLNLVSLECLCFLFPQALLQILQVLVLLCPPITGIFEKAHKFPYLLVPLWLRVVLSRPLLLEFQSSPAAPWCLGSQGAPEGQCFQETPSSQSLPFHLVALEILDFLDILLDQVGPSHLDDLAFLVVQVLQEIQTYPSPECLDLPLALFHLFCLVALSVHLSLEVLGLPWDLLCTFLGVLFLQVVQSALDPLVVHQALQFLEFQGDLEVQGVQFLHFPQGCLFLLANLAVLVLQVWLVLVLP